MEKHIVNPFDAIYKQCNLGKNKDKYANMGNFPLLVDVELTNMCNFSCAMCPTGNETIQRKSGYMTDATFLAILDEAVKYGVAMRFVRWGEPLLHPQCFEFISTAKKYGVPTHMNTNGYFMDDECVELMIKYLDSVKFSFQGVTRDEYFKWRRQDYFRELIGWVETLHKKRKSLKSPYIHVGTTVNGSEEKDIEQYKKALSSIADRVTIGKTENLKTKVCTLNPCPEVFNKLSINCNGDVTACCADYDGKMVVGNIHKESLYHIWNFNPKLEEIRTKIAKGEREGLLPCGNRS